MPSILPDRLPFDSSFWNRAAHAVLARMDRQADKSAWIVVVPAWTHADSLRAALVEAMRAAGMRVLLPPRITPLRDWAMSHAAATEDAQDAVTETARRIELFDALRQTGLLRAALAQSGPAGLWALTRQLLAMCDALTLVQAGKAPELETRLLALARGSYRDRAWEACSPEANLLLDLWRATLAAPAGRELGAARLLRALGRLAGDAPAPVLRIAARHQPLPAHERHFWERYAERSTVECLEADVEATLRAMPALAAAWPELLRPEGVPQAGTANSAVAGAGTEEGILARAQLLAGCSSALQHIELFGLAGLEDEAVCAAQRVLTWLDEGRCAIGLIAFDRVVARRTRALLERAGVVVCDETGWKYSTSSAAGVLMRWLDLTEDCTTATLLDWLKSPFVWPELSDKPECIAWIEMRLRAGNVLGGWAAIQRTLESDEAGVEWADAAGEHGTPAAQAGAARERIGQLRALAAAPRWPRPLRAHFEWLDTAMQVTGMRTALARDVVGTQMLALLDTLREEAGMAATERFDFAEWRHFIADAFENAMFRDRAAISPVVFCSLEGAALRGFDALYVIGVDAGHLPAGAAATATEFSFLTPAMCAELGLPHRDAEAKRQLADLALLLAATPAVALSWQAQRGDEPNPPAPAVERLSLLHRLAFGDDLRRSFAWPAVDSVAAIIDRPAPTAPQLVPSRLSASTCNMLVSCPYRYFVRAMLGLAPLDELRDTVEKRDFGEIVHRILQRFYMEQRVALSAEPASAAMTDAVRADLQAHLLRISEEEFEPLIAANPGLLGYRERWFGVIPGYIDWHLEWSAAGWKFEAAEAWRKIDLPLENGRHLELHGRLDRIDRGSQGLAILDYKARPAAALRTALKMPGEDVQLPFYRLLVGSSVSQASYLSVDAGKVETVTVPQELEELARDLEERIRIDFHRLTEGAGLPAHGSDAVCAYCDARGLCRKGYWKES